MEVLREDPNWHSGLLWTLKLSFYGTRAAAANWQKCVAEHLTSLGLRQRLSNPCAFWHPRRRTRTLVHGDDYASTGSLSQLDWLRSRLEEKFDMKTQVVGHSSREGVQRDAKSRSRVLRATQDRWV